jgi:predicted Rdx family selenoprotein
VAAIIEQELGLGCELVGGSGGIFEVRLDGETVFTNHGADGVPAAAAVLSALRERLGA